MGSWVRKTITSPFKKACSFFNHQHQRDTTITNKSHSQQGLEIHRFIDLQGEVMACGYEDVHVMWSILDKSKPRSFNLSH